MTSYGLKFFPNKSGILNQYENLADSFHNHINSLEIDSLEKLNLNLKFLELSKLFYEIYYYIPKSDD